MTLRPLLSLIGLALACCAPAPRQATPAMWRVADADTEIILLGTIHALPDDVAWRHGAVARVIDRADTLVLEVADIADARAQAARFLRVGRKDGLPPVAARVPGDLRGELARIAADTGPPLATLDGMKSWAAALALARGLWRDAGASQGNGVDSVLAGTFRRAGKPVVGLETTDALFALFDRLAEADQRVLLARVVTEARDPRASYDRMLDAWMRGDTAAIAASFDDMVKASPALVDALIARRNAAWADWIAARLEAPGTVLVAVGAGHLAGAGSVPARLEAKGLRVARLR